MLHVMIDLETMGTRPDAAILSIGAVKFDPRGVIGEWGDKADPEYHDFHMKVSLASSMGAGCTVDASTIMWWLEQSGQAREELKKDCMPLQAVLNEFLIWYGPDKLPTWGNGADFDLSILKAAFAKFDVLPPWGVRDARCYRTMRAELPEIEYMRPTVAHNALDDARAQAVHLQKLYNFINLRG